MYCSPNPELAEKTTCFDLGNANLSSLEYRLVSGGEAAISEQETLELMLRRSFPDKVARVLSNHLIREFGGFHKVLTASIEKLCNISGLDQSAIIEIKTVSAAIQQFSAVRAAKKRLDPRSRKFLQHCRIMMLQHNTEHYRVFFLDRNRNLIADEKQPNGTLDRAPLYIREICRRALEIDAAEIVLARHQLLDYPKPSPEDKSMHIRLEKVLKSLEIALLAHIFIARRGELYL